jgi:hypothetical protein
MDVDLDGYEDALMTTGHVWDVLDADTQSRMLNTMITDDWRAVIDNFPPLRLPNQAFRNRGDGTFEPAGQAWGFDLGEDISHAITTGDLDRDGDLDVVINRLGFPAALLRNDAGAPRIAVRLAGDAPNTRGVGAKVRLLGGDPVQSKEITAGGYYLSSPEPMVSFAAPGEGPWTLVVEWRSGAASVVEGVRANRLYEIRESGAGQPGGDGAEGVEVPTRPSVLPEAQTPLFEEVEVPGAGHVDTEFNDFQRQPLLPHRLSQMGPGVTWSDVDGDGDPDLVVTSGVGGALTVHRNDAGTLVPVPGGPAAERFDQTMALPLPATAAEGGGVRLLVGRSNHEAASPEEARATPGGVWVPLRGGRPGTAEAALPPAAATVGALAAADLDGDGRLEILVAGRGFPTAYPAPAPPRLFTLVGGELVPDERNTDALANAGLVSAALFSDIDGDTDPDLVLATDWGPPRVYRNTAGRLSDATSELGLAELTGRWNGVTAGDLTGDGRMDLILTSWGRNTRHRPTPERPLRLYWGDFDGNGILDLLEAMPDPETGVDRPETDFSLLSTHVPSIRRERLRTFREFASASVADVLGPEAMAEARIEEVVTLDHHVLYNRGGTFEAQPLPLQAQLAPAFHVAVADLDGDGAEDVFLSQNFFPNEFNTQRYAAGRGLLLRGDGEGGLAPVDGAASGIRIYGDQRGGALADVDGDGRLDLAVSQNAAETVVLRNVRGTPGLRVRLLGPSGNPRAAGARIRLVYADGSTGPAREVHLGSGYWSVDGAVQVMGLAGAPAEVEVRWSHGGVTRVPVAPGQAEVEVAWSAEAGA